jgi:hypothetical protein
VKCTTHDEFETRLFAAGRDEQPSEARLARIKAAVRHQTDTDASQTNPIGVRDAEPHQRITEANETRPSHTRTAAYRETATAPLVASRPLWRVQRSLGTALLAALTLALTVAVCGTFRSGGTVPVAPEPHSLFAEMPAREPAMSVSASVPTRNISATPKPSLSSENRTPSKATAHPTTLEDELIMLQRARTLLDKGEAQHALRELTRYNDTHDRRQMRAEAEMLRLEAVAQQGQRDKTHELARRFLVEHPHHPLADRAREFLSEVGGGSGDAGTNQ